MEPIYDMGHLANSESIDQSIAANSETFLMSNMVPQLPGFNRAIWKGLENKERRMAEKYSEVWVVTGPIYSEPMKYIGRAPIPAAFFKVFYYNGSVEAYLLPHLELQTSGLQKHRASVEAVENAAGLNL